MTKINIALKSIDNEMNEKQPKSYEDVCNIVNKFIPDTYGWNAENVYYFGSFQGIRLHIIARTKDNVLPIKKELVYCCNEIKYL